MAAALSRALKLPGKKGTDLGEYDPLTQADSDDESEEDDLVLNYPRNGLGRDGCLGTGASKLRGGRSGRLMGADDRAHEDEEEEEEEEEEDAEWRKRRPGKSRQDRDGMTGSEYWSHRDSGRDRLGEDRGGPLGGAGLAGHTTDAEAKRMRIKNAIRSAFFLVPLVCAVFLVLLCAFLLPCRKGELEWERVLGVAGGAAPPALALFDVDGDSVEDVLLPVTTLTNDSRPPQGNKQYSAVVLSAFGGQVLWSIGMPESVMAIQCGLQHSAKLSPTVILIGRSSLMALDGATGKTLWSTVLQDIESRAVLLPDLQEDSVPDLLLATLPADEASELSLTMISGLTGKKLGHPVPFNVSGHGKLIGPLLHETQQGAFYVLFGLGNVEAISLAEVYFRATGNMPRAEVLRRKDTVWEGLRTKSNSSSFVHIYRGTQPASFMFPLVAGFGNVHSSLDAVSNLNATRSDWVLVYGDRTLSVLKQRDIRKEWTLSSAPIHSQPAVGHFDADGVLDIFVQSSANGIMQAKVVSGAKGHVLWVAEFVCPRLRVESAVISTSTGQFAFLFWGSEPIRAQNASRTTVAPSVAAAEPPIRRLFLLHPAYPTILLELANTTDAAVTSAVSYQKKDATYISVASRPSPESEPGARIVMSMSLKAAIGKGRIVRLAESNETGAPVKPSDFEVNEFFRRLTFKRQG